MKNLKGTFLVPRRRTDSKGILKGALTHYSFESYVRRAEGTRELRLALPLAGPKRSPPKEEGSYREINWLARLSSCDTEGASLRTETF